MSTLLNKRPIHCPTVDGLQECVGHKANKVKEIEKIRPDLNEVYTTNNVRNYADIVSNLKYPEMPTREVVGKYAPPILSKLTSLGKTRPMKQVKWK